MLFSVSAWDQGNGRPERTITRPFPLPTPPLPAPQEAHKTHSQQGTPTNLYSSRGLTYGEKALQPCSLAPAFGQECTQIPPFILKMAKKKRLYCLQLPSQPGSSTTAAAKPTGAPHSLPTASSLVPPLTPRDALTRCTHSRTYFMVLCFMSHDSLPTALCHLYLKKKNHT